MKVLGVKQFHQMRFQFLPVPEAWAGTLGKVPHNFIAVIYGFSGNGKTEFVVQLAKMLALLNKKVGWLSYEQRHGSDFQMSTKRNNMEEVTGYFYPIDPIAGIPEGKSLIEDLDDYLRKRSSPDVVVIDSIDYTGFDWEDYVMLKNRYGHKKTFLFIAHSTKSGTIKKAISERIIFDGGMGIFVSHYIATPIKNRYGGFEPYIVWEDRARIVNPAFFAARLQQDAPPKTKGKRQKKPPEEEGYSANPTAKDGGYPHKNTTKEGGVEAQNPKDKGGGRSKKTHQNTGV
ncbi:MAG: hypothetical protein ACXIUD_09690 [Mongoliitalea sp.]